MKKIWSMFFVLAMCATLVACGEKYEDTNGADDFSLQTITDEDIIHLSQLDEGASTMKYESVDLYNLAKENVHILSAAAEEAKVKLLLTGESVTTKGIPQLISGIIYNLCDCHKWHKHLRNTGNSLYTTKNNCC